MVVQASTLLFVDSNDFTYACAAGLLDLIGPNMLLLHYLLGSLLLFLQSCYPSLAWSSKHPLFSRGTSPLFSSKPDDFVGSEALYTSADITDTIR